MTKQEILRSFDAWNAHAAHGDTYSLRRKYADRLEKLLDCKIPIHRKINSNKLARDRRRARQCRCIYKKQHKALSLCIAEHAARGDHAVGLNENKEVTMANVKLGTKAVGSIVKIKVNGASKDFIVVQQGNPNTSTYDSSCNGTWLLMKDIYTTSTFGNNNSYKDSSIHTYLNGTFYNLIDSNIRAAIKQVKIRTRTALVPAAALPPAPTA